MNKQLADEINAAIEKARTSGEYDSIRVKLSRTALTPMEHRRCLARLEHCERMRRLGGTPAMTYQPPRSRVKVAVAEDMSSGMPGGAIFEVYEKAIGGEWSMGTFYREGAMSALRTDAVSA